MEPFGSRLKVVGTSNHRAAMVKIWLDDSYLLQYVEIVSAVHAWKSTLMIFINELNCVTLF